MKSSFKRPSFTRLIAPLFIAGAAVVAGAPARAAEPAPAAPFDRTLELQGIRFQVQSDNAGSENRLRIIPSGLTIDPASIDNRPIERTIDGRVTGAEVADLNADGSPEVYVYVQSAGSGSYGRLVAYSANRSKSLSEISLPELTEKDATGYQGHDQFAVLEGVLGRRFPIYRDTDTNAAPSGGTRQVQYRLTPGEATWLLKVDQVVEY